MKYLLILCLLIAFASKSNGCGRQDSIDVFSTPELKDNSKLLDELEYRRAKDSIDVQIIDSLVQSVDDYKILYSGAKQVIGLKDDHIENLETQVEAVRPAWFDNFATGAAVTGSILAIIFLLINR